MKRSMRDYVALVVAVALWTSDAYARGSDSCNIAGTYSYRYEGTSNGSLQINEIGRSTITRSGDFTSIGTLHFFFPDFNEQGPLWLSLREEITGSVVPNGDVPCSGEIEFLTTGTVLKSSNEQVVPVGTIFFENLPRSYAYTATTTKNGGIMHYSSTAPGTIATGTAHKDRKRFE